MPQLFSPRATTLFRASIAAVVVSAAATFGLAYVQARSPATWNVGVPQPQPIPFRHDLHAGALGVDCRYCHAGVERAADAGMPSAQTCLTCHSQVWVGAGTLEPLRTAVALDQPIRWTSVHRLPDHAYFHHAAHVSKGVACETCHGRVETMAETVKTQTMSMGWCLDCHRETARARPPSAEPSPTGAHLRLTDCSTCHR
jgi:hypothetical protein